MQKLFYVSVLILMSVYVRAEIVDVKVYDDCSKNGYTKVISSKTGNASVNSTSGRTSCGYVQLWENGPYWAIFNIGATIIDYSNLIVGADPTPFDDYKDQSSYYNTANVGGLYAWNNPNLNGRKTTWASSVSTGISDVATALWGSNWKTPTKAQLDTLQNSTYTTWTWCDGSTTQYVAGCTLKGYKVSGVGDYVNYSIFLPAAGYYFSDGTVNFASYIGYYMSSTVYDSNYAYTLDIGSSGCGIYSSKRSTGLSIRPVLAQQATVDCGDSLQWEFANGVLSISGSGIMYDFTQSGQPWNAYSTDITNIVLPNDLTHVGTYAFYGLQNRAFTSLVLPQAVETIGAYAFANCNRLTSISLPASLLEISDYAFSGCISVDNITSLASTRPDIYENTFKGVSNYAYLYVPCDYKRSYQLNSYWSRFDIQCAGAEPSIDPMTDVTVVPTENTVTITWPTNTNANSYTIEIKKGGDTVCTLTFNDQGQLMNIAFAPGRGSSNNITMAEVVAGGYKFTITNLTPGTKYNYEINTKNTSGTSIANYTGTFTTLGSTALNQPTDSPVNQFTKTIKDGQLFILRDGKTYNAQGGEL